MKNGFSILVILGLFVGILGCSNEIMPCDDADYKRTCYDTQTVLMCSNGEEIRWRCSEGFSCSEADNGADCIED